MYILVPTNIHWTLFHPLFYKSGFQQEVKNFLKMMGGEKNILCYLFITLVLGQWHRCKTHSGYLLILCQKPATYNCIIYLTAIQQFSTKKPCQKWSWGGLTHSGMVISVFSKIRCWKMFFKKKEQKTLFMSYKGPNYGITLKHGLKQFMQITTFYNTVTWELVRPDQESHFTWMIL